jgi:RNA polymerase sigma factor (sigma-70 family)
MTNDAELLRRYAEDRAEDAFAELVRRHLHLVYFAALRRVGGDTHLAEDVAQGVFTALARRAASLTDHPSLDGWLYTTTRNVAVQAQRTKRRRQARELEVHTMQEISAESRPAAEWEQLRPVIDQAMDELSEPDREAILLRFFADRSFAEVGEKLALSENAARMRAERALDKLRALLVRRGITSTSAALVVALANQATIAAPSGLAATVTGAALVAGSGVGAGATAIISTMMSANKLSLGVAGVLLLAIAVPLALQLRANAELRREIAGLRQQNQALEPARAENRRFNAAVASSQDAAELARLRSRAVELKASLATLANVEGADSEPRMKRQDSWQNRGWATPTDAVETLLWASFNNEWDTVAKAFTFNPDNKARMDAFFASLPADVRSKYGTPERLLAPAFASLPPIGFWLFARDNGWNGRLAYRPVGVKTTGPDIVEVQLLVNFLPARPEGNQSVMMRHTADGWCCGPWGGDTVESLIARVDPATGEVLPEKITKSSGVRK